MTVEPGKPDLSRLSISPAARQASTPTPRSILSSASLVTGIAGLVAGLLLAQLFAGQTTPVDAYPLVEGRAAPVTASVPTTGLLTASGYVVAERQAAVASKGTGRIRALYVAEGDTVERDSLIAELENDDLTASLQERDAQVVALKARIAASEAEMTEATQVTKRMERLARAAVASGAQLDQARARFLRAEAELGSAKANLVLAEAQREQVVVALGYTRILAPFAGTVLSKNAEVGEVVAPFGSSVNARAAVVTIADMKSLEVEADVSEAHITRVSIGQECVITLDSFPGKVYQGIVSKIVPTVDRAKGTVMTKIRFLDLDNHVLPEMSAKVSFKAK